MFTKPPNSVSNIHKRWSFTRLNPSSYKISYLAYLSSGVAIIAIQHRYYEIWDQTSFLLSLLLGMVILTASNFLDLFVLRGSPLNKISKILHVSAFANVLWLLTISAGAASDILFAKNEGSTNYLIEGMSLAIGLRIVIFTSVFGAKLLRAIAASVIQPIIFLFLLENLTSFPHAIILNPVGVGIELSITTNLKAGLIMNDRRGTPRIESTFRLLQAFLAAWTENKTEQMETIAEAKAHDEEVYTHTIRF